MLPLPPCLLALSFFSLQEGAPIPGPTTAEAVTPLQSLVDIDADGRADLIVQVPRGGWRVLRALEDGSLEDVTERVGSSVLRRTQAGVWGDVDGDGDNDLVSIQRDGTLSLLVHESEANFSEAPLGSGLEELRALRSVSLADIDGDGRADLVLGTEDGVRIERNVGSLRFETLHVVREAAPEGAEQAAPSTGTVAVATMPNPEGTPEGGASEPEPVTESSSPGAHRSGKAGGHRSLANDGTLASESTSADAGAPATSASRAPTPGAGERLPLCAPTIRDASTGNCLQADSTPTLGRLYPLGTELFIDSGTGNVGVGTLTPGYALEVAGQIISGQLNNAAHPAAAIGGGASNTASGDHSTIAGGSTNSALDTVATVAGGFTNQATEFASTVAGGFSNTASGEYSAIGGGQSNSAEESRATVGGGYMNEATAFASTVAGGFSNTASGIYSAIGGGESNSAEDDRATVAGGDSNEASGPYTTIGGGAQNTASGTHATIGGGEQNAASGTFSTVGGGDENIAGGNWSTVGGGFGNEVSFASSTVAGGAGNQALGTGATVGGGTSNEALAEFATIPGGRSNTASGVYSFAAGEDASALHDRTFVWSSGPVPGVESTGPNQFLIRADGGVGIGTNAPSAALDVVQSTAGEPGLEVQITNTSSTGAAIQSFTEGEGFALLANAGKPSGVTYGVYGLSGSPDGYGGFFQNYGGGESLRVLGSATATGAGARWGVENPNNASASVKLDWLSDVARIRVGGSGVGAQNGLDLQTTGDTSLMRIRHDGKVGLGTTSPDVRLHVASGNDASPSGGGFIQAGSSSGSNVVLDSNEIMARNNGSTATLTLNADGGDIDLFPSGTGRLGVGTSTPSFTLEVDGSAGKPGGGSWSVASDRRLKKDVRALKSALETLLALRGVTYEYKDPEAIRELPGRQTGFIAQEVEEVLPAWVDERADGMKALTIRGFEALCVEALREVVEESHVLRDENERLRAESEALAERLTRLEEQLSR